jgi:hypothetical protein
MVFAETTKIPVAVVSFDFRQAFDIQHTYLLRILTQYGIDDWFMVKIKAQYWGAQANVRLNGTTIG